MKLNIKEWVAIIFVAFIFIGNTYAWTNIEVSNNFLLPLKITTIGSPELISLERGRTRSLLMNGNHHIIEVQGYGPITIRDLGDAHIDGDGSKKWGVLISYLDSDMVARYNGGDGGPINLGVGSYGEVSLSGRGVDFKNVVISRLVNIP